MQSGHISCRTPQRIGHSATSTGGEVSTGTSTDGPAASRRLRDGQPRLGTWAGLTSTDRHTSPSSTPTRRRGPTTAFVVLNRQPIQAAGTCCARPVSSSGSGDHFYLHERPHRGEPARRVFLRRRTTEGPLPTPSALLSMNSPPWLDSPLSRHKERICGGASAICRGLVR